MYVTAKVFIFIAVLIPLRILKSLLICQNSTLNSSFEHSLSAKDG